MLKKIHVRDVRLGMFIQELCGSWMDHPFWKKSFELNDPKDLHSLQTCGLQEVWIDTAKGLDVEPHVVATTVEEEKQRIEQAFQRIALSESKPEVRVSMKEEIVRARKLQEKSKAAVTSMFHEARMGNAINIADAAPIVDEINLSVSRNPEAFLNISRLKNKDDYTYLHSVAVCALMIALAKQLELSEADIKDAGMAGLLHDVGKMMIPDAVLNKPGKLTDEEFEIIKAHPLRGWEILSNSEGANPVALDVVRHHHERVDGTGYPDKISGDALTLFARMGAVCDVYDALTSNRCYKNGWEPAETLHKMAEWRNGHFDERILYAFVKTIGIYPSGTLVRLKSGKLAIVMEQSDQGLLTPHVKAFFSIKSNEPIVPELIDLAKGTDSIANVEVAEKWGFDLKQLGSF